ncbi:uncharacterized protein LOC141605942 [Silene latifolia]|uniref:uncharacterized protein LOC141605942 n=1 Tax=Silene latifolia TaxID=37657 RepID=UPI003D781818
MSGSSKVIMGATMAMVIILAFVLGLVLVLLAELYCSLLLRRRKLKASKPALLPEIRSISTPQEPRDELVPSPLSSFYAQGVMEAPRSFLFPKLPSKRENREVVVDVERVIHGKLHEFLRVQSPIQLGIPSSSSSQRQPTQDSEIVPEVECEDIEASHGGKREDFMYISNPIYDNEAVRTSRVDTPFETPDSSPSQMEQARSGSSGDEGEEVGNLNPVPDPVKSNSPSSLPLTPMKELPTKACSVPLRDARSLGTTSISDSNTHSHIGRSSSSSSGTPGTSPSW